MKEGCEETRNLIRVEAFSRKRWKGGKVGRWADGRQRPMICQSEMLLVLHRGVIDG